jgi:hypothetical protein
MLKNNFQLQIPTKTNRWHDVVNGVSPIVAIVLHARLQCHTEDPKIEKVRNSMVNI